MAECSGSRLKPLDKPIKEYITDQENKNTQAKTQRAGCEAAYSISAGEKWTKKNWRNSTRRAQPLR